MQGGQTVCKDLTSYSYGEQTKIQDNDKMSHFLNLVGTNVVVSHFHVERFLKLLITLYHMIRNMADVQIHLWIRIIWYDHKTLISYQTEVVVRILCKLLCPRSRMDSRNVHYLFLQVMSTFTQPADRLSIH